MCLLLPKRQVVLHLLQLQLEQLVLLRESLGFGAVRRGEPDRQPL